MSNENQLQERSHSYSRIIRATAMSAALLAAACSHQSAETPTETQAPAPTAQAEVGEATSQELLTVPEMEARQAASTIMLRRIDKDAAVGKGAQQDFFEGTQQNCTATHVGDGWFVTAAHCFYDQFGIHEGGSGVTPYADIYDIADDTVDTFTGWQEIKGGWEKWGTVDSIITSGDWSIYDVALVHIETAKDMPALPIEDGTINFNTDYVITGFPAEVGHQLQFQISYEGLKTAKELNAGDGQNPNNILEVFTYPNTSRNAAEACQPGMSGSSVISSEGTISGVLSRMGVTDHDTWCEFAPINPAMVEQYKAKQGMGPSPDAQQIFK